VGAVSNPATIHHNSSRPSPDEPLTLAGMKTPAKTRLKVGVLFGGRSAEHEVSILSARNVIAALDPDKFDVVPIGIARDGRWVLQSVTRLLRDKGDPRFVQLDTAGPSVPLINHASHSVVKTAEPEVTVDSLDVVFPVLHGPMGEDGTVQGLLELAGVPYVGAGVLGSAVGMDKDVMKRLLRDAGIPIAKHLTLRVTDYRRRQQHCLREIDEQIGYPLFVKPANLGSSVGISRVTSRAQLPVALDKAFDYDVKILVEAGVIGREIECAVLGNDEPVASILGEIVVRHADGFYSYDAKYVSEHGAELQIPAVLDAAVTTEAQRLAVATFQALECSGLARVDFFLQPDGALLVNEINTLPGFTAISMYPKLWAASGVPPRELVARLVELAIERHRQRRSLRTLHSL
jgi:D-alanine-D-alanine ligase